MKASELIKELQALIGEYGDLEVLTTWEGTFNRIDSDDISASIYDARAVILINADNQIINWSNLLNK